MIILGGIFILIGALIIRDEFKRRMGAKMDTIGKVVAIEEKLDMDRGVEDGYFLYPIFEYTVNGTVYTNKANSAKKTTKYHVGEEVTIIYKEDDPNIYYVLGEKSNIGIGLVICIIGIVILLV